MSVSLQKRYGRLFELLNLKDCYNFQQHLPDFAIATRIFYLVSCRHILELLPLTEFEASYFMPNEPYCLHSHVHDHVQANAQ